MARIHRFPVLAVIAFILCASSASGRDPIHVFTIDPPKDIKEQFNKLQRGENRTTAVLSLAARDESAPYIRFEIEHTEDRSYARDLSVALREIESRIQQRNNTRFNWWGKTHRFDLCSELLAICSEKKAAESLITHVMPQLQAVGREASDRLDRQYRTPHNFSFGKGFERDRNLIHIADKHVVIPRGLGTNNTIVRAETCEIGPPVMIGWFVACRSHLSYSKDSIGSDEWIQSIIIVNNGMSIRAADSSLFICDGDVELLDLFRKNCIIIANGNIRATASSAEHSVLCASGEISLLDRPTGSELNSLGAITVKREPFHSGGANQKLKTLPFGVRFLDPKDFGLELAAQNGGVQIMDITPESPFAKYGVQDADVITKIDDDVDATTIPAFRRALRRGVIRESVVLRIRRDGKDITRIVFLDGIPAPVAPPPREVKR